jgi:hypothetical protein
MKLTLLLTAACALAVTSAPHAAIITWGAATNISGDPDVSTNGTLVGAFNIGAPGVIKHCWNLEPRPLPSGSFSR